MVYFVPSRHYRHRQRSQRDETTRIKRIDLSIDLLVESMHMHKLYALHNSLHCVFTSTSSSYSFFFCFHLWFLFYFSWNEIYNRKRKSINRVSAISLLQRISSAVKFVVAVVIVRYT